jgi:hypothetical protein
VSDVGGEGPSPQRTDYAISACPRRLTLRPGVGRSERSPPLQVQHPRSPCLAPKIAPPKSARQPQSHAPMTTVVSFRCPCVPSHFACKSRGIVKTCGSAVTLLAVERQRSAGTMVPIRHLVLSDATYASGPRLEDHVERCLRRAPEPGEATVVHHHLSQPTLPRLRAQRWSSPRERHRNTDQR